MALLVATVVGMRLSLKLRVSVSEKYIHVLVVIARRKGFSKDIRGHFRRAQMLEACIQRLRLLDRSRKGNAERYVLF